jgi:hypothetical protein
MIHYLIFLHICIFKKKYCLRPAGFYKKATLVREIRSKILFDYKQCSIVRVDTIESTGLISSKTVKYTTSGRRDNF